MPGRGRIDLRGSRILLVDDQESNIQLLHQMLTKAGYREILGISDSEVALAAFNSFKPDLVLLDLQMPGLDGFDVMGQLNDVIPEDQYLPILVLTGEGGVGARERALGLGAKDFVDKPFHVTEVLLRIRNLLEARQLHLLLHDQKAVLESQVKEKTRELFASQTEVLDRLAQAAEYRDVDTGHHAQRVGERSADLARALGLPETDVALVRQAAPLHDIGKIGIPDRILLKAGPLTADEYETMKTHTTIGARLLAGGATPLIRMAQLIAQSHHEKWNGAGYPEGLVGDAIPIEARIVGVVDFFDALTHRRPYREARPVLEVRGMLEDEAALAFDPAIVQIFLREVAPVTT